MGSWVQHVLTLPAWLALLVVFAMPALESSAFVGFVFPGELALILGGVVASQGRVPLAAVIAVAVLGSAIGDSVGYWVGRRFGPRILDTRLGRRWQSSRIDAGRAYLARRGAAAVFLGRFTATLRVLIPGFAGMARMPYRRFAAANVASALTWAPMSVMFGYLGARSVQHVEHLASGLGFVALGLLVAVLFGGHLWRRARRWGKRAPSGPAQPPDPDTEPGHLLGAGTADVGER
jgi:membrane protein DedA with SNARE-associated domain